jgi:hypothetical protein
MLDEAEFSKWLIAYRNKNSLTLYDISDLTGIPVSRLSDIENRKVQRLRLHYVTKFAVGLGYTYLSDFIAVLEGR